MSDSPLVEACHATRVFLSAAGRGTRAVQDVSLTIEPGERIGLMGASGCGKSTLLHLLAGLDAPTSGSVRWPAWSGDFYARIRRVGVVFQGHSLIPALDVAENIALPLLLAGRESGAQARAKRIATQLGIDDVVGKLPQELSGGQAQRVVVARALAAEPVMILADEPTGQLDHETAGLVIDVLLQTSAELGSALVVATHDPTIARRFPDQWTMTDGCLEVCGASAREASA